MARQSLPGDAVDLMFANSCASEQCRHCATLTLTDIALRLRRLADHLSLVVTCRLLHRIYVGPQFLARVALGGRQHRHRVFVANAGEVGAGAAQSGSDTVSPPARVASARMIGRAEYGKK
jgi:hypothetical protein